VSATVSIDFLLRVALATQEQQAAIEGVLASGHGFEGESGPIVAEHRDSSGWPASHHGRGVPPGNTFCPYASPGLKETLARLERKLDAATKDVATAAKSGQPSDSDDTLLNEDELRRIYARVLLKSEGNDTWREAPLKEVFDYYCVKGFSTLEIAAKLGCSKATVVNRLTLLEKLAGVPPKRLRAYKPFFEQTDESLRDPRARRLRRRDAAYGDAPEEDSTW
jgi:hypothetical protein